MSNRQVFSESQSDRAFAGDQAIQWCPQGDCPPSTTFKKSDSLGVIKTTNITNIIWSIPLCHNHLMCIFQQNQMQKKPKKQKKKKPKKNPPKPSFEISFLSEVSAKKNKLKKNAWSPIESETEPYCTCTHEQAN